MCVGALFLLLLLSRLSHFFFIFLYIFKDVDTLRQAVESEIDFCLFERHAQLQIYRVLGL